MARGLTLLPLYFGHASHSQDVLKCADDVEFMERVQAIADEHGRDVSDGFSSYVSRHRNKDTHWGPTPEDAYGEPLKYVTAGDLRALRAEAKKQPPETKDAWAYVCALPKRWKIALWWC
jgi:hypothetical protein